MSTKPAYTIEGEQLLLHEGRHVDFDFPVSQVVEFDDALVVLIEVPAQVLSNENVFGVSKTGQILWQISPEKLVYDNSPYVQLARMGEFAQLQNWDGLVLQVDPSNGSVINRSYLR